MFEKFKNFFKYTPYVVTPEYKTEYIKKLIYMVHGRWFLHAGIVLLGLLQKIIGVAEFKPQTFLLLAISYTYNFILYLVIKRKGQKFNINTLRLLALLQVMVDQLLYTVIIYSTGGIESLSYLFYFLTIFMAIIFFQWREIILITLWAVVQYETIIFFEYYGALVHHSRFGFDMGMFQNIPVTLHSMATIALIFLYVALFAALISAIIRRHELIIETERDKIKELNQLKTEFISLAVHQVRTPMTSMSWLFQMLINEELGPVTAKQKDMLRKGLVRCKGTLEMVNNLLDLTRLEDENFLRNKEDCSLAELCLKVLAELEDFAKARKVHLEFNDPEFSTKVFVDKEKIEMVINNLVDNAIKYNRPNGKVSLNIQNNGAELILSVTDNGMGIALKEQDKITDKFYRAKAAKETIEAGSGLGLYLAKKIILKHGGRLWFTSEEGKGTMFNFSLRINN